MGSRTLTNEEKERYENELCEFITQRIKNVGNSLQFQHLTSLLPQLSFETRNAYASNNIQLMKFLKSHPKKFSINSKGIVTLVETESLEIACDMDNDNNINETGSSLPATIEKGEGWISKLHAEFGFIKATKPFETKVHFRASEFGDKDSLLSDYDLEVGVEVYFNAVKGHNDSGVKYRATKVWEKSHDQASSNSKRASSNKEQKQKVAEDELHGEGIIQKLFPHVGFISVTGKEKDTVFFHKSVLPNHEGIKDLAESFEIGDCVKFMAVKNSRKEYKAKWNATTLLKIPKSQNFDSDNNFTKQDVKYIDSGSGEKNLYLAGKNSRGGRKEMMKDIPGKISPNKSGANIFFGEKFNEIANGDNKCVYFLYGSQVTDIGWEFADGDDVLFDAVKVKLGWKAILVWVGERPNYVLPTCLGDFSEFEELDESFGDNAYSPNSDLQASKNCNASKKQGKTHSNSYDSKQGKTHSNSCDSEQFRKKTNEPCDYPTRDKNKLNRGNKQNFESDKGNHQTKSPVRDSNKQHFQTTKGNYQSSLSFREESNKQNFEPVRDDYQTNFPYLDSSKQNFDSCKDNYQTSPSRSSNKHIRKDFRVKDSFNENKSNQIRRNHPSGSRDYQNVSLSNDEEYYSASSDQSIQKNISRNKHTKKNQTRHNSSTLLEFRDKSDSENENYDNQSNSKKNIFIPFENIKVQEHSDQEDECFASMNKAPEAASIKIHKGISCEITKVHCKLAFAQHSDLQKPVLFVSNAFYYHGLPAEEQQIDDLREILSAGKFIKLNCFEIVDNSGKYHSKVTVAWLGQEPKISEMSPEDFIWENELSVTINNQSSIKDIKSSDIPSKFLRSISKSNSDDDMENTTASLSNVSLSKNSYDESSFSSKFPKMSETKECAIREKSSVDYKLLSDMITQELESRGLLLDSEVNLNTLSSEIVDLILLKQHAKSPICSQCGKTKSEEPLNIPSSTKHKEAQTIVTGEIVAQNKVFFGKRK